ncbi:MAG: hypothetical protein JW815_03500 [Candidatus Bathyarchaeota archaeon]|nr:hypothetical protein [Candidatus Bathyarchaeum sp.]
MTTLNPQQIAEYFSRSYTTADGLWFMKVEEKYGFDAALEVDAEVWKVLPKIQARLIKKFLNLKEGPDALLESLKAKLKLEGFKFTTEKTAKGFQISVMDCPWHNLMIKSGREDLAEKVGKKICSTEYRVWVSEFAKDMNFMLKSQKCGKADCCILEFIG